MLITQLIPKIDRFVILLSIGVILTCFFPGSVSASDHDRKRVLVLHSYHPGLQWTNSINKAIEEVFSEAETVPQLHVEYLDAKRYHDPKYLSYVLEELFQHKLANLSFDLILLSDNDALKFVLKHRNDLFAETPIVFCGVNNFQPAMLVGVKGITGVAEILPPRETIELALRLHPETEAIVAINSTKDVTGREVRELFLAAMSGFQDRVRVDSWDDLPVEELQAKLSRLPESHLVFLNGIVTDQSGRVFSYVEEIQSIRSASPAPLYGYWDFFLGQGIVGGELVSGTMQGRLAAQLALRILGGENPDDIAVISGGANVFMFDYRELKRFAVPMELLPENSIVINRPLPFYEISKKRLWAGLAIMAGLIAVTGVLITNILLRRQAEQALRESEMKFRGIFDHSFSFMGLMTPDGVLVEVNKTACEFMGIEESKVLGTPFWETPWWAHSPDLQKQLGAAVKTATEGACVRFESTHPEPKGNIRYFDFTLKPITDESGKVVLLIPEGRDITERKQVEESLRDAHRELQEIIEFLPDATFVINKDKKVMAWNRAMEELSGVRKEEMLGKGDYAYAVPFYGECRPILIDLVECPLPELKTHYDIAGKARDTKFIEQFLPSLFSGKGGHVWATASPLCDQEGNLVAAIESIRDITERKRAEEALKVANRELDAFVYTVSHDLRTPLTPILGYVQILRDIYKERLDKQGLDMLAEIERSGDRMLELLENLLALAKVGYVERPAEPVDVNRVVQDVVDDLAVRITSAGLAVKLESLPAFNVPGTFLTQVFDNLVGNAIRYAGQEGGPIEVGSDRSEGTVRFYVRDHGLGIPAEERSRIFDVFYRSSAGKNISGTGVGLATVQKIARLYGGKAWAEETPGGGATFWVEMPDVSTTAKEKRVNL